MSKVMMMPVPRFVSTSSTKQESDEAIASFIKDELDYDLLAEYFLEDGAFDTVGSFPDNAPTSSSSDLSQGVSEILKPNSSSTREGIHTAEPASKAPASHAHIAARTSSAQLTPFISTDPSNSTNLLNPPMKRKRVQKSQPAVPQHVTSLVVNDAKTSRHARPKSQAQIERRRERNKILARRTRLRKKFFFESLQKEVCDLQTENLALKGLIRLHFDSDLSKKILDEHKASEQLSDAVLEQCGLATNLDKQDFNLVQSLKNSQKCFVITDPSLDDNPIVFASDTFTDLTGFAKDDILGRNCRFLQGAETDASKISKLRTAIKMGEDVCVTMINYKADGTPFWNNLFVAALRDSENNVVNYIGVLVEVQGPEPGDPEHGKALPEHNIERLSATLVGITITASPISIQPEKEDKERSCTREVRDVETRDSTFQNTRIHCTEPLEGRPSTTQRFISSILGLVVDHTMPTSKQVDAPISLISFFPDSSDSEPSDGEINHSQNNKYDPCYETQSIDLCGRLLLVRQYAFHSHNANQVWPGTFNLAEYLLLRESDGSFVHNWGSVLELGTATGLLSMRLSLDCSFIDCHEPDPNRHYVCSNIVTSDVEDEHNDIEQNLHYNYTINNFTNQDYNMNPDRKIRPIHIPHTWGSGWDHSLRKKGVQLKNLNTIIGSDILLYVNAYSALVQTLKEIFELSCEPDAVFIMSWNRRMKQSEIFFEMMTDAGFMYSTEKNCIYCFSYKSSPYIR